MAPAHDSCLTEACLANADGAAYPIGTPGTPWGASERAEWLASRKVSRSYQEEVLSKLESFKGRFDVTQYGALSQDPDRYPLFSARTRDWSPGKPSVLVTGGVHGYETSGVQGALLFLETAAESHAETFNILVAPCVCPWGYEAIERWTAKAVDPNRSFNPPDEVVEGRAFNPESATEESAALIRHLASVSEDWLCHLDLHETTDSDVTEFGPAKSARDGKAHVMETVPDGFYLVADSTNPQREWLKAIIDAVRKVTHIAPPDDNGRIVDEEVLQEGVAGVASLRSFGICAAVTNAPYAATTEVYPDSPKVTDEDCNLAQVAAVTAALGFLAAERAAHAGS